MHDERWKNDKIHRATADLLQIYDKLVRHCIGITYQDFRFDLRAELIGQAPSYFETGLKEVLVRFL